MLFYNTVCKWWIELFGKKDNRELKYYVSLCLVFKDEASFLKEWLDYHLTVGIDHFYLYNNNSTDDFLDVLKPYIDNSIVTLHDFPLEQPQLKAYEDCYTKYRHESNWIGFIDVDEFVCPKNKDTIGEWLLDFSKYPAILIHWLLFGTGGNLKHDYSKRVIEQYHICWDDLSMYGKCFINTRFDIANLGSWKMFHHTYTKTKVLGFRISIPAVNQFGYICTVTNMWGGGKNKRRKATIQLNHYKTKAWDVWEKKPQKTDAYFLENPRNNPYYFYKYEKRCISCDFTIFRFIMAMNQRWK